MPRVTFDSWQVLILVPDTHFLWNNTWQFKWKFDFFLKPALLSETHKDLIGPVEYLLAFSSESSPI